MRLTGLNSRSLSVELYVFGHARATAPHFKVESCTRPNIVHPLLRQWIGGLPVATKLTRNTFTRRHAQGCLARPEHHSFLNKKTVCSAGKGH